jgi:hypothetical protein
MIRLLRAMLARRRLERMTAARRESFAVRQYAKRRKAALKRTPRVVVL